MKHRPISPIPITLVYSGNYQRFLIDTGGDVCLINASALKPETIIDIGKARRFRGLSDSTFETLGVDKLKILNIEVEFQVCREDLPFPGVGILGNNFLETEKAEISYDNQTLALLSRPTKIISFSLETTPSSNYTIPPRMKMVIAIPIQDFEKSEGYLPRMDLPDGVLGGEAVVKVEDGYATCMIINLNSNSVDIEIGPQILEEFEFDNPSSDSDESDDPLIENSSRIVNPEELRHKITEQYAEGLSYNPEGRQEPQKHPINDTTENHSLGLPISALPKTKKSNKKLSDEEAIQSVKRPGHPLGSKNRPRVSSAPEVRETIASRLKRRELGKTRVPPKINYRETGRLVINSEDPESQETADEEQGDDEVFLPVPISGPSTNNPTPDVGKEGDDEAEKDDETEKDNETTVPQKQRRKTRELVKMFDELLQKRPPSENIYTERALERIRREEAISNYTPQEYAEIKRTSSDTPKNIRQSLNKLPPLWRNEEDSLNEDTAPEINVDEFLRDNSDQSEEGSSNISPEETGGIEDPSETELPIIIEPEPSTSVNNVNTRNKNNLTPQNANRSRFTGYLGDGPEPRTPIFGRVLIPDELAAMGIRYDYASGQIVDENGKGVNETAETESADPNNTLIESERGRSSEKSPNISKLINSQNNNNKNKSRNNSENSSDPDKSDDRPTTSGNKTVGDDVGNHRFGPPFVAYDPPTFEEAEDIFAERHHRPKLSSPSSSDENVPPKSPEIKIKFSISRDGLTYA
ncbi:Protein of unknown function [Cotesia congregata]|uniref:Peptidase A2 domain-containing protein n=1 Tax=Cotesia congregata TaxID=51543 RepID=A0A8J2MGT7_COTCN|nr:Protein of unknown function [Cotesia congregata]